MVRVQPSARSMVTESEYLWLAMTSPMNNCPGGIGPELRKQYAREQLAKKKEAALQEKFAKMALADANRAQLSEKAQRRKEKRKKLKMEKKKKKAEEEKKKAEEVVYQMITDESGQHLFIGPEKSYPPPDLTTRLEYGAAILKGMEPGNDTIAVKSELRENYTEKSYFFEAAGGKIRIYV